MPDDGHVHSHRRHGEELCSLNKLPAPRRLARARSPTPHAAPRSPTPHTIPPHSVRYRPTAAEPISPHPGKHIHIHILGVNLYTNVNPFPYPGNGVGPVRRRRDRRGAVYGAPVGPW